MIFDSIPREITAGDDISWTINPDAYPSNLYTFKYGLVSDDGLQQITIVQAGTSGDLALFVVKGSDSAKYVPLTYFYQLYAFLIADETRTQFEQGEIRVLPDLTQTQPATQNQRTLKAISDLLEGKANDDIQTCSANGKNITAYSFTELTSLKTYFQGLVNQEINLRGIAAGRKTKRQIKVRFSPVGGPGPARRLPPGY